MPFTEELAQARSTLRGLEVTTSEAYQQQKIAMLMKNEADLIRAFLKARAFVSPRWRKRLKDRWKIYREYIEPHHYAIHIGENKIEYKTR